MRVRCKLSRWREGQREERKHKKKMRAECNRINSPWEEKKDKNQYFKTALQ